MFYNTSNIYKKSTRIKGTNKKNFVIVKNEKKVKDTVLKLNNDIILLNILKITNKQNSLLLTNMENS